MRDSLIPAPPRLLNPQPNPAFGLIGFFFGKETLRVVLLAVTGFGKPWPTLCFGETRADVCHLDTESSLSAEMPEMQLIQDIGCDLCLFLTASDCCILDRLIDRLRFGAATDIHQDALDSQIPSCRSAIKPAYPKPCVACGIQIAPPCPPTDRVSVRVSDEPVRVGRLCQIHVVSPTKPSPSWTEEAVSGRRSIAPSCDDRIGWAQHVIEERVGLQPDRVDFPPTTPTAALLTDVTARRTTPFTPT